MCHAIRLLIVLLWCNLVYAGIPQVTSGTHEMVGVGVLVGIEKIQEGRLVVLEVVENTSAARAGLMAGDEILQIDQDIVAGLSFMEAVEKLRGEEGSEVLLVVQRQGSGDSESVTLMRESFQYKR